jgi:hypothetical protein
MPPPTPREIFYELAQLIASGYYKIFVHPIVHETRTFREYIAEYVNEFIQYLNTTVGCQAAEWIELGMLTLVGGVVMFYVFTVIIAGAFRDIKTSVKRQVQEAWEKKQAIVNNKNGTRDI